ncbi:unnamed protein product [Blepharisma stoltei]|uniref:GAF domain-containing protein n=1 Tax=Blepharisma stoltei TaxID=1481888 RepID=A0AAU9K0Z8_9CILI|nr:unnamed protein product [Blepharisma stoltei]
MSEFFYQPSPNLPNIMTINFRPPKPKKILKPALLPIDRSESSFKNIQKTIIKRNQSESFLRKPIKIVHLESISIDESSPLQEPKKLSQSFAYPSYKTKEINTSFQESNSHEPKQMLLDLVAQEKETLKVLENRCHILGEIQKIVETSSVFTERDGEKIMKLIQEISVTILDASNREIELGLKNRELEQKKLQLSLISQKYEVLQKRALNSESELKDLRGKIKNLNKENAKQAKVIMTEKQKFYQIAGKLQTLEEGFWAMTGDVKIQSEDACGKLKSAINALIKDGHEHRKEIGELKKEKEMLEQTIKRLSRKISRLTAKINENKIRNSEYEKLNEAGAKYYSGSYSREINQPRTLPFRINSLTGDNYSFMNEIIEHGIQALPQFIKDPASLPYLEILVEKLLNLNEFVEQFGLLKKTLSVLISNESLPALIETAGKETAELLNSERCHYWLYEKNTHEIWTIDSHSKEYRFSADTDLFTLFKENKNFVNSYSKEFETNYSPEIQKEMGYKTNSLLAYPIFKDKENLIGILEIVNHHQRVFEHDDEYLAEMIIPILSALTLQICSMQLETMINKIKNNLIKCGVELIKSKNLCDFLEVSEKWLCKIFSVSTARVCIRLENCIVRSDNGERITMSLNTGICGCVFEKKVKEYVVNPYNDLRFNILSDIHASFPMNFIPILGDVNTIAVFQIPEKIKVSRLDSLMEFDSELSSPLSLFSQLFTEALTDILHKENS